MRRFLVMTSFALCLVMLGVSVDRLCHRQHTGFSARRVRPSNLLSSEFHEPSLSEEEKDQLFAILSKKFTFYYKGIHSHAFISEDGCYVLHFLAEQQVKPHSFLDYLPMFHSEASDRFHEEKKHWETILSAWQTAILHLKDETGLIYAHVGSTDVMHKRVLLMNQKLEPYWVDLNKTVFYLQRHPSLFYLRLHELIQTGDLKTAKTIISSVFSLADHLLRQGCLHPASFELGLLNDRAIQTNVSVLPSMARGDIEEATLPLRHWLETNAPALLPHFEGQLAVIKAQQEPKNPLIWY